MSRALFTHFMSFLLRGDQPKMCGRTDWMWCDRRHQILQYCILFIYKNDAMLVIPHAAALCVWWCLRDIFSRVRYFTPVAACCEPCNTALVVRPINSADTAKKWHTSRRHVKLHFTYVYDTKHTQRVSGWMATGSAANTLWVVWFMEILMVDSTARGGGMFRKLRCT